MLMLEVMRK